MKKRLSTTFLISLTLIFSMPLVGDTHLDWNYSPQKYFSTTTISLNPSNQIEQNERNDRQDVVNINNNKKVRLKETTSEGKPLFSIKKNIHKKYRTGCT